MTVYLAQNHAVLGNAENIILTSFVKEQNFQKLDFFENGTSWAGGSYLLFLFLPPRVTRALSPCSLLRAIYGDQSHTQMNETHKIRRSYFLNSAITFAYRIPGQSSTICLTLRAVQWRRKRVNSPSRSSYMRYQNGSIPSHATYF